MQGGTAGSSPYFNDRNLEVVENYWESVDECAFLVKLQEERPLQYGELGNAVRLQSVVH